MFYNFIINLNLILIINPIILCTFLFFYLSLLFYFKIQIIPINFNILFIYCPFDVVIFIY